MIRITDELRPLCVILGATLAQIRLLPCICEVGQSGLMRCRRCIILDKPCIAEDMFMQRYDDK